MQLFKIWIVVCLLLQLFISPVSADQDTNPSVFERYGACLEYHRFLSGHGDYSTDACHPLPEFLMAHADLSHQDFIVAAGRNYSNVSGLSLVINTLYSFQNSDNAATFYWGDQADRTLFARMHVAQDYSRAYLYSLLISGIKYEVLDIICESSECNEGTIEVSATDELGDDYSIFDQVSSDMGLLCLLRTDGFVTPIANVVSSQRFQACMFPS